MTRKKMFRSILIALAAIVAAALCFGVPAVFAQELSYQEDQVFTVVAKTTDGSPYSSGVPTTKNVVVTMAFKEGVTGAAAVKFEYAEVSKTTAFDEVPSSDWKAFSETGNATTGGRDVTRTFSGNVGGEYNANLYFRSVYTTAVSVGETQTYYYSDRQMLSVTIVPEASITALSIRAEARMSATDGGYAAYDGTSWIAHEIRYTVSAAAGVDCFYQTVSTSGVASDRFPMFANPENAAERILTLKKESFPSGFEGTIAFSYNDPVTGDAVSDEAYRKDVRFDPVEPEFQVKATYLAADGRIEEYQSGMTSSNAVNYELSANAEGQNPSGVKFYYYTSQNPPSKPTDTGVTEIVLNNGKYIYTATATTRNLRFMAVSGAGVVYLRHERNYETQIDLEAPVAKVTATDGRGKELGYVDGDPSVWASQSVTFVLQNLKSNAGAKFEYRFGGDANFTELQTINGQRQVTFNFPQNYQKSTLTDQVVYFRITSAAGVASATVPFRYSLAKSDFTFGFEMDAFTESVWVSDALNLSFMTDTRDYTFGYRVQDANPEKPLIGLDGIWEGDEESGYIFRTALAGAINGYVVNFYAVNLAGVECETAKFTPTTLKMDTEEAKLLFKGALSGAVSGSYIDEGQWVNGNVRLTILAAGANISGYTVTKLIHNAGEFIEDCRGELTKDADGNYTDSLAYTGVYYYKVKTGAGRESRISYRVNVDSSAIVLNYYEARIGDDGEWMSEEAIRNYLAENEIAGNLYLRFSSNHTATLADGTLENHYVFYTAENGGAYRMGDTSGTYVYDLSAKNDSGSVSLAFYLESTAIDRANNKTDTKGDLRELHFRYNRIGATLAVELDTTGGASVSDWNFAPVKFILINTDDIGETGKFIYQYSTDDRASWNTISTAELLWDSSTTSGSFEIGKTAIALNGKIYFRVLNSAGYISTEPVAVPIKLDTTTPDPLRSVDFGGIQYTTEGTTLYFSPDRSDNDDANHKEFRLRDPKDERYAPTRYYYSQTSANPPLANGDPADGSGWTLLEGSGFTVMRTMTVGFYATNGHKSQHANWTIEIDTSSDMKLQVGYSMIDGKLTGNLFRFYWSDENRVLLTASGSATDVKYYYSVKGTEIWTEMADQGATPAEWQKSGTEFQYVFKEAILGNVLFKAVNKGGKTVVGGTSVVLAIDTTEVDFRVDASVDGVNYDVLTHENSGWSNYDILFEIVQTSENPSGVNYQYALGGYDNEGAPSDNSWRDLVVKKLSSFLLDNLNNGNLEGRLWVRASKNATPNQYTQKSLRFRVDKLDPNFNMEATYQDAGGASRTVTSGEWFNSLSPDGTSSAVNVYLTDREQTYDPSLDKTWKNASNVRYFYKTTGEWVPMEAGAAFVYSNSSREKVTFRAVSEAGKQVEQTFYLNIDNVAPVFKNGNGNKFSIANGENGTLNTYFVDQVIRWENESEESLDSATVNGLRFINGSIVSTHDTYLGTPGTDDYGKVTILVKDKAGNTAELKFILRPFPLTVETISLSVEDTEQLRALEAAVADASGGAYGALIDNSRRQYFNNLISRLNERQSMLETEIRDFQDYLKGVYDKASFTLESDFKPMNEKIEKYKGFPDWQQQRIRVGAFESQSGKQVDYQLAYENLIIQYNGLETKMQQVQKVEMQVTELPAVKAVEKSNYAEVMKVYAAFQSLTTDQKSSFQTNLYDKLDNLKKRCEVLLMQDETQGVSVDGDKLPTGAQLQAKQVGSTTGDFASVQKKILEGYESTLPRALILLVQLSLKDLGSNASTLPSGKVLITIDIPDDQQDYIRFCVFEVKADGSVSRYENVVITPDGKSVQFESDSLNGTYALTSGATVADVTGGSNSYAQILGVKIDGPMIVYLLIAVGSLILILILVVIFAGMRKRSFLKRYDTRYKQGLAARGIDVVPKGNKARRTHPFREGEYLNETRLVMSDDIKPKKKKKSKSYDEIDLDD